MRGEDRVTMVFLGEGATETGVFYETINFAGLKGLPLVFLVENNLLLGLFTDGGASERRDRILGIARAHGHRGLIAAMAMTWKRSITFRWLQ